MILWHITVEQRFQVVADSWEEACNLLPEYSRPSPCPWLIVEETIEKKGRQVIQSLDVLKAEEQLQNLNKGDDND